MTVTASHAARMPVAASVWLIPVGAREVEVRRGRDLLRRRHAQTELVDLEVLRRLLDRRRPRAAILLGGPISASLLDAQRWLEEFKVPTMVVVDHLTPHFEAILLERGAQDVVSSATVVRILAARFEALLRNADGWSVEPSPPTMRLHIDPGSRSVRIGTQGVHLTRSEFDLLLILTGRPGVVVTRDTLFNHLQDRAISSRALESRVSRLRQKLRDHGAGEMVETVRGIGYRFNPTGKAPSSSSDPVNGDTPPQSLSPQ